MEATLEERVQSLEQQVADLISQLTGARSTGDKDWRLSVGMLPQDEISDEADRLGREARKNQVDP